MPSRYLGRARGQLGLASLAVLTVLPLALLASDAESGGKTSSFSYSSSSDVDAISWAWHDPASKTSWSMHVRSDGDDVARRLRAYDSEVLWFQLDGEAWVSQDAVVLERAREIMEPILQLGRQQGMVGREQGTFGRKQGSIGRRQGAIGARQGQLGAELARMAFQESRRSDRERDRIEDEMNRLSRQIEELSREHEPLARQQEVLASQQAGLAKEMERINARASVQMRELAERAVRDGKAKRASRVRGTI